MCCRTSSLGTTGEVYNSSAAELVGIRFYDVTRHERTEELDYGGRNYNESTDRFLPYPLGQLDLLPQLKDVEQN